MLLSAIYLHRRYLAIGTYPDLSLQITGFLMGGCPYIQVGGLEIPAIVGPDEVPRILGLCFFLGGYPLPQGFLSSPIPPLLFSLAMPESLLRQ